MRRLKKWWFVWAMIAFDVFLAASCGSHAPDQTVSACEIELAEGPTCSSLIQRNYGPVAAACSDGQEHLYPVNAKLNCRKE